MFIIQNMEIKKIRKITIKTLLRKLNNISFQKRWYQTIREAQKGLE